MDNKQMAYLLVLVLSDLIVLVLYRHGPCLRHPRVRVLRLLELYLPGEAVDDRAYWCQKVQL